MYSSKGKWPMYFLLQETLVSRLGCHHTYGKTYTHLCQMSGCKDIMAAFVWRHLGISCVTTVMLSWVQLLSSCVSAVFITVVKLSKWLLCIKEPDGTQAHPFTWFTYHGRLWFVESQLNIWLYQHIKQKRVTHKQLPSTHLWPINIPKILLLSSIK